MIKDPCMKNITLLTLVIFMCGCASKPRGPVFDSNQISIEPSKALIFIYRENNFTGSANSWILADHGKNLAVISNNTYYAHSVAPGKVVFSAARLVSPLYAPTSASSALLDAITAIGAIRTNSNPEFKELHTLDVEAGKTYYFRWKVDTKFAAGSTPLLVKVDENQGKKELEGKLLAGKYKE